MQRQVQEDARSAGRTRAAYCVQALALGIACVIFWCAGSYTKRACFDFQVRGRLRPARHLQIRTFPSGQSPVRREKHNTVAPAPS